MLDKSYEEKCFVCGEMNPDGMHLEFRVEGDKYVTEFEVRESYQGFPGIMHGGLITAALDEVMGRFLFEKGYIAYTAEMTVRFRKPVACGSVVRCEGEILNAKGRLFETRGRMFSGAGDLLAEATGRFVSKEAV